ncbi:MAG: Gfo/Idh/MocA family protein [Phycisphaerae bacterium]
MARTDQLRIGVAGLQFGTGFLPALLAHPRVGHVGICDVEPKQLAHVSGRFGLDDTWDDTEAMIDSDDFDAICLFTPIPQHADQVVACMAAGKHAASAVPMATSIEDCRRIISAVRDAGLNYMMMETSCANDEYFYVKQLHERGRFGRIQFMRGRWHHNLENHPNYWLGLPPMHYTTHPIGPMLDISGRQASKVCCFGTGVMRRELVDNYDNPYPGQTAIFQLSGDTPLAMEVTSMVFHTALEPKETFDLYGEKYSFTWASFRGDSHALVEMHEARPGGPKTSPRTVYRMQVPPAADRLPEQLWSIASPQAHLVDEFVSSIVQQRRPRIDEIAAARFTAPGLCAHQSALAGGEMVDVPSFE